MWQRALGKNGPLKRLSLTQRLLRSTKPQTAVATKEPISFVPKPKTIGPSRNTSKTAHPDSPLLSKESNFCQEPPHSNDGTSASPSSSRPSSYGVGDLVEFSGKGGALQLGVVVSDVGLPLTLHCLTNSGGNGTTAYERHIMPHTVRFHQPNWAKSRLSPKSTNIANDRFSARHLDVPGLVKEMARFEDESFLFLKKYHSTLASIVDECMKLQVSPIWTPTRLLLSLQRQNKNDAETDKSHRNYPLLEDKYLPDDEISSCHLHAMYRYLFFNTRLFVKPPYLGPNGPYFARSYEELQTLKQTEHLMTGNALESFRQKLKSFIARWQSILPGSLSLFRPDDLDNLDNEPMEYRERVSLSLTSTQEELMLDALKTYACSHIYNEPGHPYGPIITKITSGIIDDHRSCGDLYAFLEKTGLLPKDHNLHWEQSCLQLKTPLDVLDAAGSLPGTPKSHAKDMSKETSGVSPSLSPAASLESAPSLPCSLFSDYSSRHNFDDMLAVAIDSADTFEIDDALSVERGSGADDGWWIHVHVADPTAYIEFGSTLDRWSAVRTSSIYVPEDKLTMLPEEAADAITLSANRPSLALTFSFLMKRKKEPENSEAPNKTTAAKGTEKMEKDSDRSTSCFPGNFHNRIDDFGDNMNPLMEIDWNSAHIRPSIINRVARITYEDVDAILNDNSKSFNSTGNSCNNKTDDANVTSSINVNGIDRNYGLENGSSSLDLSKVSSLIPILHRLAKNLAKARTTAGAANMYGRPMPEVIFGGPSGDPSSVLSVIDGSDYGSPSRMLVSEMMIAGSCVAARFAKEERLSIPYRVQPESASSTIMADRGYPGWGHSLPIVMSDMSIRNTIPSAPSKISLEPGKHVSMGLDVYCRATSPMRRYADMLIHHQIKRTLAGKKPIEDCFLRPLVDHINDMEPKLRSLQRRATRFWVLTFIMRQPVGKKWKALVVNGPPPLPSASAHLMSYPAQVPCCQVYVYDLYSSFSLRLPPGSDPNEYQSGKTITVMAGGVQRQLNQVRWYLVQDE